MRVPPLPPPATYFTPDQLAARAVGGRPAQPTTKITLDDYDPEWPKLFEVEAVRIRSALGPSALAIEHVGSTAVPGLAAKRRLDIDLIVADPADESAYVPVLEPAGYFLRSRDPEWYEHRCLWTEDHGVNLHVFGPDCDEHLRHLIFRDWLRAHPADRDRYEAEKRRVAEEHPWDAAEYINQKAGVIIDILRSAGLS
ncbi:MAG TPA: GrpB family protein [Micromonosporaceae bacterium]|jgi:GrpB-like predicted nucleotidyltransferase (UPF0157 family)